MRVIESYQKLEDFQSSFYNKDPEIPLQLGPEPELELAWGIETYR